MLRTFQFRLSPNAAHVAAMARVLADNCETYNAALQERREAWKLQRKSIGLYNQQKELTELRKDIAFQWIAVDIQRDPLRRVEHTFQAFFRRCKAGTAPGFPRFQSRHRYDSFTFGLPVLRRKCLKIPKIGYVRARGGRDLNGCAKFCTVRRDGKRWIASIVCDIGAAPEKRTVINATGIDVGLTTLATLSDGAQIENPRWSKHHERRLLGASRALARKQRRSGNRLRAKEILRRASQRAASARKNYIHHVSKRLVGKYDLIAHENLNIRAMSQGRLARSIMDAAWATLLFQLKYKAESAGVWVVAVNPRGTSQRCSGCDELVQKTLSQRAHDCPCCGLTLDRDHNAAINILRLGMSLAGVSLQDVRAVCMSSTLTREVVSVRCRL